MRKLIVAGAIMFASLFSLSPRGSSSFPEPEIFPAAEAGPGCVYKRCDWRKPNPNCCPGTYCYGTSAQGAGYCKPL